MASSAAALARDAVISQGGNAAQQTAAANAASVGEQIILGKTNLSDAQQTAALGAIANDHPIAMGALLRIMAEGKSAKWEQSNDALNPITGIRRRRPYPVKILPASVVLANGAGQLTFTPQEEFEPFRLMIPSGQAGGPYTFSQLTAGDRLLFAQSGRVPGSCLSEKSDLGRIDFPRLRLGENVTLQVQQVTPSGTPEVDGLLFGFAMGKPRKLPEGAEITGARVEPFDVTVVAANSPGQLLLNPQRNVIMRRIGLDDTVANFSSLLITSINVQDDPQFTGNAEFPAEAFSQLGLDEWLDFDMCQLGGQIVINVRNTHATLAVTAQGMATCDVVKLPNDAR